MGEAAEKLNAPEQGPGPELTKQLATMDRLPSLYYLTAEVAAILDAEEGEADLDALDALLPSIEQKAAAVAHFAQMHQDQASLLKTREQAFAKLRKSAEGKAERALAYLQGCLELAEIQKVTDRKSGTTVALQTNPPSVNVTNEEAIPRRYWTLPEPQPLVLDKRSLLEDLKAAEKRGEGIPGAELKRSQRIVIK